MSNETRKAEARGETTAAIEFRGETFTVSTEQDDFSVEFLEALEDGRTIGMVRGALGPRQWREVQAMQLKLKELRPFADDIARAMGFGDAGESAASSD
jgi:hypothetical protein